MRFDVSHVDDVFGENRGLLRAETRISQERACSRQEAMVQRTGDARDAGRRRAMEEINKIARLRLINVAR